MKVTAAVAANDTLLRLNVLPYNTRRRVVPLLRAWQEAHGLDPDGIYDRATEESLDAALIQLEEPEVVAPAANEEAVIVHVTGFPAWPGPTPMTSAQWYAKVGTPGPPGSAWADENIVDGKNYDERHGYTGVHRLAKPYADEGIARVRSTGYRLIRVGGYVYRHMRDNPNMALSKHASGLALDLNAKQNFAKYFDVDDDGPEPFSPAWKAIWNDPDAITPEAVAAMKSCGWKWGGDWKAPKGKRGYKDPQHFQR